MKKGNLCCMVKTAIRCNGCGARWCKEHWNDNQSEQKTHPSQYEFVICGKENLIPVRRGDVVVFVKKMGEGEVIQRYYYSWGEENSI